MRFCAAISFTRAAAMSISLLYSNARAISCVKYDRYKPPAIAHGNADTVLLLRQTVGQCHFGTDITLAYLTRCKKNRGEQQKYIYIFSFHKFVIRIRLQYYHQSFLILCCTFAFAL